jgi:hypothetical protein
LAGWYAWCQSSALHGSQRSSTLRLLKAGDGVHRERDRGSLYGYYRDLNERLRYVTIHYGNWSRLARVARHCARLGQGDVAVFLDPPYVAASRKSRIYRQDSGTVAYRVHHWALAAARWGVKVALAGYAGDYEMPNTWRSTHGPPGSGGAGSGFGFRPAADLAEHDRRRSGPSRHDHPTWRSMTVVCLAVLADLPRRDAADTATSARSGRFTERFRSGQGSASS